MFDTFRNAWKTPDLRKRILYTFLILLIFRLGCSITVPMINPDAIKSWIDGVQGSALNYMSMLSGGDYERATLFALGVQPYINASIIMQLLTVAIPALENISKEGPEGQQRINRYSRYFGGALAVVLGVGYYFVIRRAGALQYGSTASGFDQVFSAIVIIAAFAAGSMLLTWMGEQIDSKGVGNGVSFIIFAGIVSRWSGFGSTIKTQLEMAKEGQPSKYVWLIVFAILALLATVLVVLLNSSERRIPVQYAKKVVGRKMYGGQSSFIPIKVNMSGVMPVIFASSLTQLPSVIITLFGLSDPEKHPIWTAIGKEVSNAGWIYAIIYALFIVFFNYFYVAITYNPIEISNNIRRNNGSIPGIRPGKPTTEYITRVISKVTLIGAIFLIVVAVGPILLARISGLTGMSIGGTSLLIVVGVALDTSRSLDSFMLMKYHKGFLE